MPIPLAPEQRIKELEEPLRLANQKAEFFEAVVEVMEKDYGVSVKKRLALANAIICCTSQAIGHCISVEISCSNCCAHIVCWFHNVR